jgi:hypothetical protein
MGLAERFVKPGAGPGDQLPHRRAGPRPRAPAGRQAHRPGHPGAGRPLARIGGRLRGRPRLAQPLLLLVTLGSPLGLRTIVYEQLRPQPPGFPPQVARWVNIADRDDFVAAAPDLTRLFATGQPAKAVLEGGWTVDNGAERAAPRDLLPDQAADRPPHRADPHPRLTTVGALTRTTVYGPATIIPTQPALHPIPHDLPRNIATSMQCTCHNG